MAIKQSALGFLVVSMLGLTGCFSAPDASNDRDDDEKTPACKTDNDCKGARVCVNAECVDPTPGTGGAPSTGGAPNTGGTPNPGGAPNTGGTTETGGSPSGGAAPAGGSPSGGTGGGPETCTSSSPLLCEGTTQVKSCVNGTYQTFACSTGCATLGFASGPCAPGDGCQCGSATDAECSTGASAFAACAEWAGAAWTDADTVNLYISCHTNDPADDAVMTRCFENYVSGTTVDCESAITYCIPG